MNRPFLTLMLSILPFPVTFADPHAIDPTMIAQSQSCTPVSIKDPQNDPQTFCMHRLDQQIFPIKNAELEKKISLFAGDNLTTEHHSATGYIGFSSREYDPKAPETLLRETYLNIPLGSFGKAPTQFSYHEMGNNNFGYIIESSTNYQGIESGGIHIIAENNGKTLHQYIPTFADDFGYHGDETIAETITYTVKIQDDQDANIYPLKIILNGKYEGIEYSQTPFLWRFDETTGQYLKPDNYPQLI